MITVKQTLEKKIADLLHTIEEHEGMIEAIKERLDSKDISDYDKFSLKIDLRKHTTWLNTLMDIHAKRHNYFFNHYLPEFESQTTQCNAGWDELWKVARELDKAEKNSPTMQKIRELIETYPEANPENHQDIKNQYYKTLELQVNKQTKGKYGK